MKKIGLVFYVVLFLIIAYIHRLYVELGILHTGDEFLRNPYMIMAAVMFVLILFAGIYLKITKFSLIKIYPIVVLVLGLGYMYVFPAMSAPDEIAHFISAYKLSNRIMGTKVTVPDGHVVVRATDIWIEDGDNQYIYNEEESLKENILIPEKESFGKVVGYKLEESTYRAFLNSSPGINTYNHIEFKGNNYEWAQSLHAPVNTIVSVYLPGALGISLARILNLNTYGLLLCGRLANLLVFIMLTMAAIKFLPKFKEIIFLISLLPMSLELAASFSYDAVIISSLMFFVSYVFYLIYEKDSFNIKDLIIISLIAGLIFPCKIVYAPLLLILFGIPLHKFAFNGKTEGKIKRENIIFFTASALTVLLCWSLAMYLVNKYALVSYSTGSNGSLEWAGEESYSINYLIHNRLKSIKIFYNTILLQLEYYHQTMVGFYLGNADEVIGVPYVGFVSLNIGLIMSIFSDGEENFLDTKGKVLSIISLASAVFLILLSMLIAWTPISSHFIEGVSGRYFLPLLLPLFLVIKNNAVKVRVDMKRNIVFLFIFINALSLLKIFSTVCIRL